MVCCVWNTQIACSCITWKYRKCYVFMPRVFDYVVLDDCFLVFCTLEVAVSYKLSDSCCKLFKVHRSLFLGQKFSEVVVFCSLWFGLIEKEFCYFAVIVLCQCLPLVLVLLCCQEASTFESCRALCNLLVDLTL